MRFEIVTLFPEIISSYCKFGIVSRAISEGQISVNLTDLRHFGIGKHRQVDDLPYGGGVGLIFKIEPIYYALESIKKEDKSKSFITSASGIKWDQKYAELLKEEKQIIIVCGRYEGYDERVTQMVDYEVSIGDFILTGGELCALTMIDSVTRLIPGVLRKEETFEEESFTNGMLEYPQYTRPQEFNGLSVPSVLLSGHHAEIKKWREEQSRIKTQRNRPDLYKAK